MNVYDFDRTIYDGDSTIDFYLYSIKKTSGNFKVFATTTYFYNKI